MEGLSQNWSLDAESNEPKDHLKSLLETYTVEFLCRFQDVACLKNMTSLYSKIPSQYFENPNNVSNPYDLICIICYNNLFYYFIKCTTKHTWNSLPIPPSKHI